MIYYLMKHLLFHFVQPTVWAGYGKNKKSAGELWLEMFRYYTETFRFNEHVITIRQQGVFLFFYNCFRKTLGNIFFLNNKYLLKQTTFYNRKRQQGGFLASNVLCFTKYLSFKGIAIRQQGAFLSFFLVFLLSAAH